MLILNTYKESAYNLQVFSDPINHLCSAVATLCQKLWKRERKSKKQQGTNKRNVLTAQKAAVILRRNQTAVLKNILVSVSSFHCSPETWKTECTYT